MSITLTHAITLQSPWGQCITHGTKRIENRSWQPRQVPIPCWLGLHTGHTHQKQAVLDLDAAGLHIYDQAHHHPGCITALVHISDVVTDSDDVWFDGQCKGWVIDQVIVLNEPVPTRGNRNLWPISKDALVEIARQVHQVVLPKQNAAGVVHAARAPFDIYIGRAFSGHPSSPWRNQFKVTTDDQTTRTDMVLAFCRDLLTNPKLDDVHQLRGQVLGCWCAPLLCHGHVLVRLAHSDHPGLELENIIYSLTHHPKATQLALVTNPLTNDLLQPGLFEGVC